MQVARIDWHSNALTLHGKDGTRIEFNPVFAKSLQVYHWETRTIAQGDRLEFRTHDKKNHIANHSFATIKGLDADNAKLQFDSGREMVMPLAAARHVDLGYCSTSHAAQGASVDRVILNLDTMRSDRLVNHESFYVGISRGRYDSQLFTDSKDALRNAVSREQVKEIALDARKLQQVQQQLQPQQSTGVSMSI